MPVAKIYNTGTSQWEPALVGKQGPAGATGPTGPIQTVQTITPKTGAYVLAAPDASTVITLSGTFTVTVPGNVFVAGNRVDFINIGTGVITFAGSSLTLTAADSVFTINRQWASASVFFTSATTAVLIGYLG